MSLAGALAVFRICLILLWDSSVAAAFDAVHRHAKPPFARPLSASSRVHAHRTAVVVESPTITQHSLKILHHLLALSAANRLDDAQAFFYQQRGGLGDGPMADVGDNLARRRWLEAAEGLKGVIDSAGQDENTRLRTEVLRMLVLQGAGKVTEALHEGWETLKGLKRLLPPDDPYLLLVAATIDELRERYNLIGG
ncbi:unnamed protein product [Vitrella brassicaformis CCMP3155]|uniref:Uncharacterized protein n=1 Tax=Vitrella brassicaformis (strain CCMP3155) TaxID=1169540 RepID=A0A0G4F5T7_VITBC|nr:unnamed protein product [Vitrella brassicaformis CCMP3155]|mmetsp:Transcript_35289/g.87642  ORF Transcript_35289/g.87642 Transcript_35289/m.87642 type:complete len:195 (-) Transcript_35289:45-629(-)|eukprot:CEM07570.1 unnamed protein product [Vitrella brassicaformis CCMP3155]